MAGNMMCGLIFLVAVAILLCVPSGIIWLVTELPNRIRKRREMRIFKKSHRLYSEVRKPLLKNFYL